MNEIAGHSPSLFSPAYFERQAVYKCLTCGLTGVVATFKSDPCTEDWQT